MIPALLDIGWLGSPVDVATFVLVLIVLRFELKPRQRKLAAGVVALARERQDVDDDRLQSALEIDDELVESMRTTIVRVASDGQSQQAERDRP